MGMLACMCLPTSTKLDQQLTGRSVEQVESRVWGGVSDAQSSCAGV